MTYFTRTEESRQDAQRALERGAQHSPLGVCRLFSVGASGLRIPMSEQLDALQAYGYDINADDFDLAEAHPRRPLRGQRR